MIDALDPFVVTPRGAADPNPVHAALREAGPIVRTDAPAGGSVWIVTDEALARQVLSDPRIVKDPAFAPAGWDARSAGLEDTAAERPSLTTFDGPAHAELRRAHVPLFTARRMRDYTARVTTIARELLAELAADGGTVDLMADFTTRYPLTVLFDLLGVPLDRIDEATSACRAILGEDPARRGMAIGKLMELASAALRDGSDGLGAELRTQLPDEITDDQLLYLLFGLIFAGQLTTDTALGFVLAQAIDGYLDRPVDPGAVDAFVQDVLRRHPPAPFTLWRFASTDVELGGVHLPARSPLLVDVAGINNDPGRPSGPDLTFGAGPHYCIGAQLAAVELRAAVQVLLADYPDARLTVPFEQLRLSRVGGIQQGDRMVELPVRLHG